MFAHIRGTGSRPRRPFLVTALALAGLAMAALAGVALAKTFVLNNVQNATVTNAQGQTSHATIVVNARGRAVYTLSGDNAHHPKCTSSLCRHFWPPVTVSSAKKLSKAPGIVGKLGSWRHNGFLQVTLAGHPLYTFSEDTKRDDANGEGIRNFGGVWHVIKTSAGNTATKPATPATTTPMTSMPPPMTTTTTTSTPTNPYPPGY